MDTLEERIALTLEQRARDLRAGLITKEQALDVGSVEDHFRAHITAAMVLPPMGR